MINSCRGGGARATVILFDVVHGGGRSSSLVVESKSYFQVVNFWYSNARPRVTLVEGCGTRATALLFGVCGGGGHSSSLVVESMLNF